MGWKLGALALLTGIAALAWVIGRDLERARAHDRMREQWRGQGLFV